MSIDINVYLRNKGGRTTRAKAKLSAKETHSSKKGGTSATKKDVNNMGVLATFMSTGNPLKSGVMKVPVIRSVMATGKVADKAVNFGTAIYQAHSGENMISGNIRATSKIASTFGVSYLEATISNELYRRPTVERQNYMLDYGKELYNLNIENNKNQLS
jgi:hypothetical protein